MKHRWPSLCYVARWAIGSLLCLVLPGCTGTPFGLLDPSGPIAAAQHNHLLVIIGWMLVVTVPLFIALPIVLWRYRLGQRRAAYRPQWEFSWLAEILIWGIPSLVVCVLGVMLWHETYRLDPYRPIEADTTPLEIHAVGLDWKWLFIYPRQGIAAVNEVLFITGRPVRFRMTSGTVLQSFMIPRLGGQMYAMPGMVTELHIMADKPGSYRGLNTQFNGRHFAKQKFTARAVSAAAFQDWVKRVSRNSPPLNATALADLQVQSVPAGPVTFGRLTGDPLAQIVAQLRDVGIKPAHPQRIKQE